MNLNVVGLDIAKLVFHMFMMQDGKAKKKKLKRSELLAFVAQMPVSVIAMEACRGAHHWARAFQALGHEVVLLNTRFVKAFVVGNKNDYNDAEAIYTAACQPNKRSVAIKGIEQQDLAMLQGVRRGKVDERTALVNQMRGYLAERGIVLPRSVNQFRKQLPSILEDGENDLSTLSRKLFAEQYQALKALDEAIRALDREITAVCQNNALARRLLDIPGIGPLTAILAAADVGDGKGYDSSRDYAASLGVVPRQHSSGDKQVLLGISKRGNRQLRTSLIHGARAVLKYCGDKSDPLSLWLKGLIERRGFNKAAVALANKNARIIWALATRGGDYVPQMA
ncbi:IS110 family transposase [Methylomarinum sp. Ch1-1]|uniref:IS110 family transposase n=1 Tax=Methylomarinum roseum TaxID=3067653 RepID=A0AAU7NZ60_9GAMM|nr:IS110 family transposase [Methylomarinum sp. Ch1-1]MDP4521659.1 IS110 family transposase [Methylomarinum sp. Ch1-1]